MELRFLASKKIVSKTLGWVLSFQPSMSLSKTRELSTLQNILHAITTVLWKQLFTSTGFQISLMGVLLVDLDLFLMLFVFKERLSVVVVVMIDENEKCNRRSFRFWASDFTRYWKAWLHNVTSVQFSLLASCFNHRRSKSTTFKIRFHRSANGKNRQTKFI